MHATDLPDAEMTHGSPPLAGHRPHTVLRSGGDRAGFTEIDELATEIPIALEYNGIAHATLLATPTELDDLALGFSFTEGIIRTADDLYDLDIVEASQGIILQATIASACLSQLKARRRNLAGRTGCGLCGIESLDEVRRMLPAVMTPPTRYAPSAIAHAVGQLATLQPLHRLTGATHAAGWASPTGDILHVREDVGRHNALDKLIGHVLRHSIDTADGMAVISSRASFEMVQKAASAGISALIAVSAPTTYAVDLANELNMLLAGFAREHRFTAYSHPEFLGSPGDAS